MKALSLIQTTKVPQYFKSLLNEYFIDRPRRSILQPTLGGAIYFQTLAAGVDLGVFDLLHQSPDVNTEEFAKRLNLSPYSTRVLLLGLTTLGLVENKNDRLSNTKVAATYLVSTSPKSMVNIVRWQNHINYRPMAHFTDSLRAEKNLGLREFPGTEDYLYGRLSHQPKLEIIFQKAMEEISAQANSYLAQYFDFSNCKMIMDIGGGTGRNLVEIAKVFPKTKGFVFDLPSVCERAKENFAMHHLSDRFTAIPGNCFTDNYPKNPDTILFCHFMTIWSPDENQQLIQKAYDALPHKGRLIIFNMISHNNGQGPLTAAMGSPYFITLATGKGMLYSPEDYKKWFKTSGFRKVTLFPLPMDHRVFVAEK